MNKLIILCKKIIVAFRRNALEEGYDLIMQFAESVDEAVEAHMIDQLLQLKIQQQLIVLRNLLDIHDDEGVVNLFENQIMPLAVQINHAN